MKKIFILLLLLTCSTVSHKPLESINLDEAIQKVEKDENLSSDKKDYYSDKLKNAKQVLDSQLDYIVKLENEKSEMQKSLNSQKDEIAKLSEAKGRIKQVDYQFWGFIGLAVLFLIGLVLYILIKFGNIFSPAKPVSSSMEIAKEFLK